MTPDELADRTRTAARAALDAGRALGLEVDRAAVLHDAFSVVVHLEPAPVVARVQVVLPPALSVEAQAERQQRELDVAAWLDDHGVAVVPPTALVPRSPVRRDGFGMTFWELADVAEDHVPYAPVPMTHCAELHAALAEYPAELPFLTPFNRSLAAMLDNLDGCALLSPADVARARAEHAVLRSVFSDRAAFEARFPDVGVQTIHGDGPSYNVIRTTAGLRFSDFEEVTCGPVEWDLALADPAAVAEYDEAARTHGLRTTNPDVQHLVNAAAMLNMVSVLALVPQLPLLADGMGPTVESWRATPSLA
ncbi:phosphotransferase [Mycolicibacterium setense]|uniref:phosphotransferase n=1 Tax=Mycolicibacterium setense TaxID=431269 RepID=UPI0007EA472B|nr:phosphotransferase [Mycolicibacterium setense]OBB13402.1 phosphotransferase [Mycolicibacterium setense]